MNEIIFYCGIDVFCDTLDVCYQTPDSVLQHSKVPNDEKGFRQLLKLTGSAYHL